MTFRARLLMAALSGACLTPVALAQEPARLPVNHASPLNATRATENQRAADAIASHLRQSGQLHNYSIDIAFADGTAILSGNVADQAQHDEAVRLVQGMPGVERVRDLLHIDQGVQPVQASAPLDPPSPLNMPGMPAGGGAPSVEPMPLFNSAGAGYGAVPPNMPPYAWPTYAPYNNYSRVGYPQAYPYNAWPFIGPMYPFPKVPLGWRSVKLQWQDGHWWFSQTATKHDWWRVRYW